MMSLEIGNYLILKNLDLKNNRCIKNTIDYLNKFSHNIVILRGG